MTTPPSRCSTAETRHPVIDRLLRARNGIRSVASAENESALVGADLYFALGTLAQCSAAVNQVIEQFGTTIGRTLGDGTAVADTGPYAGAPDTALLKAVFALASASAGCEPVTAAVTDAQIAVSDLAATRESGRPNR